MTISAAARQKWQLKQGVIALTELSVILQGQKKKKSKRKIIDALQMYGEAVANASLGRPWQGSHLEYEPKK